MALQHSRTANDTTVAKDRLMRLIEFLQKEVEAEQRITMAVNGFTMASTKNDRNKKVRLPENKDIPTTTGLHVKVTKSMCIFCEGDHASMQCEKARKMKSEEKERLVKEK